MEALQMMEHWHWWVMASALFLVAIVKRRRVWIWPALIACLVGYLVWVQPGMFWQRQWLIFIIASLVLVWLGRRKR